MAPLTDAEFDKLPLQLVSPELACDRALFVDGLIRIWCQLTKSGSLATLPPVPDIVNHANQCYAFCLVYHTNTWVLRTKPGTGHDSSTGLPPPAGSFERCKPPQGNKRWHPYSRLSPSKPRSDQDAGMDSFDEEEYDDHDLFQRQLIGCVYLSPSSSQGSVDVGIALRPDARGRGYGRVIIKNVLRYAFESLQMHRVVANVFGSSIGQSSSQTRRSAKESGTTRCVFERLGFTYEGAHRRSGFSATDGTWRDVHVLAMLDTDWVMSQGVVRADTCPWEKMIQRHEREREEMSELMEDPNWGVLRRSGSTETLKAASEPITEDEEDDVEDLYDDDDDIPIASPVPTCASVWQFYTDVPSSPDLMPQTPSPVNPFIDISPPGSITSSSNIGSPPSDLDWRSISQLSESSGASRGTPSYAESSSSWSHISSPPRASSVPIFDLDSDEEDISPSALQPYGDHPM